jgi:hypothetical protein
MIWKWFEIGLVFPNSKILYLTSGNIFPMNYTSNCVNKHYIGTLAYHIYLLNILWFWFFNHFTTWDLECWIRIEKTLFGKIVCLYISEVATYDENIVKKQWRNIILNLYQYNKIVETIPMFRAQGKCNATSRQSYIHKTHKSKFGFYFWRNKVKTKVIPHISWMHGRSINRFMPHDNMWGSSAISNCF